METSKKLINLFESEDNFFIRKKILKLTNNLKIDLLLELESTYLQYIMEKFVSHNDIKTVKDDAEFLEYLKKYYDDKEYKFEGITIDNHSLTNGKVEVYKINIILPEISIRHMHESYVCSINFKSILSDYIESKSVKKTKLVQIQKSTPEHVNIISNNGFELFEHILNEYVKPKGTKGRLSDIHFFYWSMFNNEPQLIHQRPEPFKSWFFKHYQNEDLGKVKTYLQVQNPNRKKHFSNALDWFKLQKY